MARCDQPENLVMFFTSKAKLFTAQPEAVRNLQTYELQELLTKKCFLAFGIQILDVKLCNPNKNIK